jgi:hypothetical protein
MTPRLSDMRDPYGWPHCCRYAEAIVVHWNHVGIGSPADPGIFGLDNAVRLRFRAPPPARSSTTSAVRWFVLASSAPAHSFVCTSLCLRVACRL